MASACTSQHTFLKAQTQATQQTVASSITICSTSNRRIFRQSHNVFLRLVYRVMEKEKQAPTLNMAEAMLTFAE
jgi:hypothetical protein